VNKKWNALGYSHYLSDVTTQIDTLPPAVYKLEFDTLRNVFYLDFVQNEFYFPYKVYGVETKFVDRMCKTWHHTDGNLGILLNGLKGTGKTVTAELICNELKMPVILVQKHHENLVSFLNTIHQNVIVFIDEYEKIFDYYSNSLLSIMDGAFKTSHRKLFILTTNELKIDKNLMQRPSRIRYIKTFSDLSLDVIEEIVDDMLVYKDLKNATIKMISELPIITIDLVKAVIEEVNIHEEDPAVFKNIFNINGEDAQKQNVYKIDEKGDKVLIQSSVDVMPTNFTPYHDNDILFIGSKKYGRIEKVIHHNQIIVSIEIDEPIEIDDENQKYKHPELKLETLVFEPSSTLHRAFYSYAF